MVKDAFGVTGVGIADFVKGEVDYDYGITVCINYAGDYEDYWLKISKWYF